MAASIVTLLEGARRQSFDLTEAPEDTVGYWLHRLSAQLDVQSERARHFERYYNGDHPLQFATSKFRETFGNLFSEFADNWCEVVVDSSLERLTVQGFRFGAEESYEGDEDAWEIWQANKLDSDSVQAHQEAIKTGEAYVIVDAGEPPRITVESPHEVTIASLPGDRRVRVAALKRWIDFGGYLHATVYLPEGAYRFISEEARKLEDAVAPTEIVWTADEPEQVPNPFGRVIPVLPLRNRPPMIGPGRSDLAPVIDVQNAVNKLCTDMIVASEYAGFRQRWGVGIEIPVDPETGRRNASRFLSSIDRIWTVDDPDAKFGEFEVTPLENYVKAIEMLIQHLAAQTRTPPHYLTAGLGQWPSGDSLKASEAGLVAKVKRKQLDFSETWEEALRLAFLSLGDEERAAAHDAEVIWADPEYRTEGQRTDALVKMRTLGVPLEALWSRWGASPQEIERWKRMLREERELGIAIPIVAPAGAALPPSPEGTPPAAPAPPTE